MGRKSTKNLNLPPHLRARVRGGTTYYYYDQGGKPRIEIPLGKCYIEAVRKWADLEGQDQKPLIYFKDVAERYLQEIIPLKAPRTQADNLVELKELYKFFNDPPAPIHQVRPVHVRQYLDQRTSFGTHSTTRANRERSLLSHIFNMARTWGVIDTENPCRGIKGYSEAGRNIYIEDNIYDAVYEVSTGPLRDALELAYLIGQRPVDVLKILTIDIRDNILYVEPTKTTNVKIRISIEGRLKLLIEKILDQKKTYKIFSAKLICNERGQGIGQKKMADRFRTARSQAAELYPELKEEILKFQFRDLRAKSATDKAATEGMYEAKRLAGHSSIKMTEKYVRNRKGELVKPLK